MAPSNTSEASSEAEQDRFKPYDEVVPETARRDSGLFTIRRTTEGKLFYEIPDSLLDRDMLLVSRLAQVPSELGPYVKAGRKTAERVVRWTRQDDRLLLRPVSYTSVASDSLPIARSVRANTFEPILASFDIQTLRPGDSAMVVEVSNLFTTDVPALNGLSKEAREELGISSLDEGRTFIDYAHSFPRNTDVRHTLTFNATGEAAAGTGALSIQLNQSMVLLARDPMPPRHCDPRVGYFGVERINYGSDEQKAAEECFIRRWNLVPSDMQAYRRGELVEPKTPIVFYLDPATPRKWRPYFKKGIEDWNEAFRAAGFKNAIVAKDPPDDSTFSPEDVRYSTVRYAASTTRNAMGPSVADPRSGEIIESDIVWYHNHLRSYRNRLIIETGAANPEARSLTLPEELIGETMRKVIAHEVGHAIGLPHNMVASSAYPVDSLRSPSFTAEYGVAPSIMDYARQNYIAQPGDEVKSFIRKIGPYDEYAVRWGYTRFPGLSPQQEEARLDSMIRVHADDPMYRYVSRSFAGDSDPRAQTEDLGADPLKASELAVRNLKRVVPNLRAWATRPTEDYGDLKEIYGELLWMWRRYMGHVTSVVGGVHGTPKTAGQDGPVYEPVPRERQEQAVQFLAEHAFETPTWLLEEEILRRIEGVRPIERMRTLQMRVLTDLLDPERMQRLVEAEVRWPEQAYPLLAFMEDVKQAVWRELRTGTPQTNTYRRHLQRGYLKHMEKLLESEELATSDIPSAVRGQLKQLRAEARRGARRTRDASTRLHLRDVADRIEVILSPEEEA